MNDLPWAPMQGALIIHDQGWDRLDPSQQEVVARRSREGRWNSARRTANRSGNRWTR